MNIADRQTDARIPPPTHTFIPAHHRTGHPPALRIAIQGHKLLSFQLVSFISQENSHVPVSLISVPSRNKLEGTCTWPIRPIRPSACCKDNRTWAHCGSGTSAAIPTPAAMPTPHLPGAESTLDPWRGLTTSRTTQGEPCQPSCWWGTLSSHSHSVGYRANTTKSPFPFPYPLPSHQDTFSTHSGSLCRVVRAESDAGGLHAPKK